MPAEDSGERQRLARCAFVYSLSLNVAALALASTFMLTPVGAEVRPMGFAMLQFLLAGFALLTALPFSIYAIVRAQSLLAVFSAALALAPLPVTVVVSRMICEARNIVWSM